MENRAREYCAYFGEATEVWKRHVIGEIIVAFDEYRDSVCQTLQDAANSGPSVSTEGGQDINNQEEMFGGVLENAQQQAEQRIVNALNQTLNQPPPVLQFPVVSIIANQTDHVNPPGESAISQAVVNCGQIDGDHSLDVSIKSEVDSSSESECESDTDDEEVQVKEEPNEEEDITARYEEQTENTNNFGDNRELNAGEESDQFEEQVNMSGVEDKDEEEKEVGDSLMDDEDSSDDTTDDDDAEEGQAALNAAGPSTSTGRRSTRRLSKRQIVSTGKSSKGPIIVKTVPLSVITKKLKCTVPGCKKMVKNKSTLNEHFLSAHKLKHYRCLVRRCYGKVSTSFTSKIQLSDHIDQVHGRTTRLACKCSKKFTSYSDLCTHYRKYHELGHFACSKDNCTFKPTKTRIKVMIHQYNHREANFECLIDGCGKSFKQKNDLNKHSLTHTGERPFVCPECGKSFNRDSHLTVHLRSHRNDKCYKCTWPQCTHSSTNHSNVIAHIRVVHFKLPRSKRQQTEEGIEDDRDPRVYLAKD